jgi:HTH-type transcriptional regulator / antitoxin HigA
MVNNEKFNPGIAIPPGETLQEILEDREITQKELAARLGLTPKHVNKIIKGTATISHDTAIKLESVLGISASFWNNLEMKYQETKARLQSISDIENEKELLKLIPYAQMSKMGWIEKTQNQLEKIINLRSFYEVASLNSLSTIHQVAFRKSTNFEADKYALSAWLTQAEKLAKKFETTPYRKKDLENIISDFRLLTKLPTKASIPKLKKLCASVGIALVIIPHISKTYINGATKWLNNNKVMIALSPKGGYEDIFWFTFFHEVGHVLQEQKSSVFVDGEEYSKDELEIEADKFSLNTLIPEEKYNNFIKSEQYLDKVKLREFSDEMQLNIGIIVGRLMKDGYINYSDKSYEQLRRKISYSS